MSTEDQQSNQAQDPIPIKAGINRPQGSITDQSPFPPEPVQCFDPRVPELQQNIKDLQRTIELLMTTIAANAAQTTAVTSSTPPALPIT